VSRQLFPAGVAGLQIARDVAPFNPAEQVFRAMLDGWRNKQLSRTWPSRRSPAGSRSSAFRSFTGEDPWSWTVGDVDEFLLELRAAPARSRSATSGTPPRMSRKHPPARANAR
jgi:hypothetical protein